MSTENFNLEKWVRPSILKLEPYSSARDEFKQFKNKMIYLDANENPYGEGLNRYPDPNHLELREKIASIKKVAVQQILLGNGSDEVLDLLFRAFCEPAKDNVLILPPTYGMYQVLANLNDVECRKVYLTSDFQPDVEKIVNSMDAHTKMIFLCSPNNPTGNLFSEKLVEEILHRFSGLVVIDEAYIDFAPNGGFVKRLQEFENLIITQTFSKAYGLAGIRIGICFASPQIIKLLNKIKPPYNINSLSQKEALEHLNNRPSIKEQISTLVSEREKLSKEIAKIAFVDKVYPSNANFLLAQVDDANKRYEELLQRKVVTRNRSNQPLCTNCLRFTVGTPRENEELLFQLKDMEKL